MTPYLSDYEGNSATIEHLTKLTRHPSLGSRGMLNSLQEGIVTPGEDARFIFVRGLFYRQESVSVLHAGGGPYAATLVAEPENEADPFAVAVILDGEKVGYVPRELAIDIQPLVMSGSIRVGAMTPISEHNGAFRLGLLLAWRVSSEMSATEAE